jgi:N-acetylglucosaminyldiphosphoundecaprenol N-acetyl-beta-D-mannosaminyltransferase
MVSEVSNSRSILGMKVNVLTYRRVIKTCLAWSSARQSRYVAIATVNNVMESYDNPGFKEVMNQADLVTSDGMPLVFALRALGAREARRVYGPDLTPLLLLAAEKAGVPVGLYGSSPEVVERLKEVIAQRWPRLTLAYTFSPPFRPLTPAEDEEITASINNSGARILFVGLSTPKQERWMAAHRGKVSAVMLGVGAAFDFLAGSKPQAPRWMMHSGLEWLFRLGTEPRRLAMRYIRHNPRFMWLFARQLMSVGRSDDEHRKGRAGS